VGDARRILCFAALPGVVVSPLLAFEKFRSSSVFSSPRLFHPMSARVATGLPCSSISSDKAFAFSALPADLSGNRCACLFNASAFSVSGSADVGVRNAPSSLDKHLACGLPWLRLRRTMTIFATVCTVGRGAHLWFATDRTPCPSPRKICSANARIFMEPSAFRSRLRREN